MSWSEFYTTKRSNFTQTYHRIPLRITYEEIFLNKYTKNQFQTYSYNYYYHYYIVLPTILEKKQENYEEICSKIIKFIEFLEEINQNNSHQLIIGLEIHSEDIEEFLYYYNECIKKSHENHQNFINFQYIIINFMNNYSLNKINNNNLLNYLTNFSYYFHQNYHNNLKNLLKSQQNYYENINKKFLSYQNMYKYYIFLQNNYQFYSKLQWGVMNLGQHDDYCAFVERDVEFLNVSFIGIMSPTGNYIQENDEKKKEDLSINKTLSMDIHYEQSTGKSVLNLLKNTVDVILLRGFTIIVYLTPSFFDVIINKLEKTRSLLDDIRDKSGLDIGYRATLIQIYLQLGCCPLIQPIEESYEMIFSANEYYNIGKLLHPFAYKREEFSKTNKFSIFFPDEILEKIFETTESNETIQEKEQIILYNKKPVFKPFDE